MAENLFEAFEDEEENVFEGMDRERQETRSEQAAQSLKRIVPYANDPREALPALVGGLATKSAAGLAGLGNLAYQGAKAIPGVPGEPDWNAPAATVRGIEQWGQDTFGPKTPAGQATTGAIGEGLALPADAAKWILFQVSQLPPEMREEFMAKPLGESLGEGAEAQGAPPVLATVAHLSPDAILAAMGVPWRQMGGQGPRLAQVTEGMGPPMGVPGRPQFAPTVTPPLSEVSRVALADKELANVAKPVMQRKEKPAVIEADPNPEMVQAFDDLGIEGYTPGMVSESAPFRQVQSGMKSMPESKLKQADVNVRAALNQKASDLVDQFGRADRSALDADLRSSFRETITGLANQSDEAFKAINTTERLSTPLRVVDIQPIVQYLERQIRVMGGVDELSKMDRRLYNLIFRQTKGKDGEVHTDVRVPTYGKLDHERKLAGMELRSPSLYRDSPPDSIDHLYGILAESQGRAANRMGFGKEYKAANELVVTRKQVELASIQALGREMAQGVISAIDAGATKVPKGDVAKYNRLMAAVPPQYRQQVAMAVLERIMMRGQGGNMQPSFVKAAQDLQRNKVAADAIFSHLPAEARVRFNKIAKAAEGFFRSLETDNTSNTAQALRVMDSISSGGMTAKLSGVASATYSAEWMAQVLGLPPGVGGAIGMAASGTRAVARSMGAAKTRMEKADDFLVSDTLNQAVRDYAAGRPRQAQQTLNGSRAYQEWLKTTTPAEMQAIRKAGFFTWLLQEAGNE